MRIESREEPDAVLVVAAQGGSLQAFGALYGRYHNPIVALAYARTGDRHLAEDAAQEAFAIACRGLGSLRDPQKFGPWLGGICRNVARQMVRKNRRVTPVTEAVSEESGTHDDGQSEAVRRAVWKLPEGQRELIVMRYFDGFSQAKISDVLGIGPSAVNGRLVRAKRKVAEMLKREGFGS